MANYTFYVASQGFLLSSGENISGFNLDDSIKRLDWQLFNYHFKDELTKKYNSKRSCIHSDDVLDTGRNYSIQNPEKNLNSAQSNDFVRYDIQRNEMSAPVKIYGQMPYFVSGSLKPGKPEKPTKKTKIPVKRISLDDMIRNQQLKEKDDQLSFENFNWVDLTCPTIILYKM